MPTNTTYGELAPHHWSFWLPWAIVALSITIISHMPQPPRVDLGFEWSDKVLHAVAYWIFGSTFLWMVLEWKVSGKERKAVWLTVAAVAVFGLVDEIHQAFVPGREADLWDWVADVFGGTLATFGIPWLLQWKQWWRRKAKGWRFFGSSIEI